MANALGNSPTSHYPKWFSLFHEGHQSRPQHILRVERRREMNPH